MTSRSVVVISPAPKHWAPEACSAECTLCGIGAYSEKSLAEWARIHSDSHIQKTGS